MCSCRITISTVHKLGMLMPESVWDLSKRCWKYDASERPAANAIADMVAAMERQKLPSGETRRVVFKPADYGDAASGPSVSILLGTGEDPSPLSTVKTLSSTAAEGRQRIRRVKGASRTATVRFGPLDFGRTPITMLRSPGPSIQNLTHMSHITRSELPGIQLSLYSLIKAP